MSEGNNDNSPVVSRRTFLKVTALSIPTAAAAVVIARKLAPHLSESAADIPPILDSTDQEQKIELQIGKPEAINFKGVQWYPDGHTSFIKRDDGSIAVWFAGGPYGYMATARNLNSLGGEVRQVLNPGSRESFDRNYAAPGSVIPGRNNQLLMLYHGEYHPQTPNHFPFNSGIGLAISGDGGASWQKKGQILKGKNDQPATDRVYGAGQPCAIIKGDYVYMYYIDWNGQEPDALHLARSPIDADCAPNSWEKFNNGKFENTGMNGPSTPVILPSERAGYAALPGVSWNSYLNKFLAVIESKDGFYITTSTDGIDWAKSKKLLGLKTANNDPKTGETWNSYPTLLSSDKSSDRETGKDMILIYSEGLWNSGPHRMMKRPISMMPSKRNKN